MREEEILETAYQNAKTLDFNQISPVVKRDIDVLMDKISSNKSLISALVTSLMKKILEPQQDIRLHRTEKNDGSGFIGGYSARTLDTKYTMPFFKNYFPRYANKESSFLTLSLRAEIKWNKKEGQHLKIRNKQLKESFLNIFEQVEENNANPTDYLQYIFAKLIALSQAEYDVFHTVQIQANRANYLNIYLIVEMLQKHFESKQSSRLPVIAIYSIPIFSESYNNTFQIGENNEQKI
ncbi:hypothetical protein [Thioflexithrix psekupsensis]|uniref:Uncharacterized protein n=1 Tax=Thioflexithrix psekupsensis TaxID=1570016 RepID=A0A251X4M9_9GAMM|nr:hypothetical protein [Thioflexithrix psekupsensis]OUD12340.1 hypothetical protein TPSD3_14605 [Thioflexithrix psekupsensis]